MAKQKPPKPAGKISGFPYSILWEEFGEIWDNLEPKNDTVSRYEALITWRVEQGQVGRPFPSRDDISRIVSVLELKAPVSEELVERLYGIAAAYCLPRIKAKLGLGARATAKRLSKVSRLASQLVEVLVDTDTEIEIIMELVRCTVVDPGEKPQFNLLNLTQELRSLASSSRVCASEIPNLPRGKSINVMQARLMQAATRVIGEASKIELEVKQFDGVGPCPRPGSASSEVLFKFLDLVDPAMTDATKVRLFRAYSKTWYSVTLEEIARDEFPRKLRARQKARAKIGI